MPEYRKKAQVEARQLTRENWPKILAWIDAGKQYIDADGAVDGLTIFTLEGRMKADFGDWIVKGIKGEFWPVKADVFAETYALEVPDHEHTYRPNGLLEPTGPCVCCNAPLPEVTPGPPGIAISDEAVALLAAEGIVPVRQDDLRAVLPILVPHASPAEDAACDRLSAAAAWQGLAAACAAEPPSGVAARTVTRLSLTAALRAVLPFSVDAELTDQILAALPEGIPHA